MGAWRHRIDRIVMLDALVAGPDVPGPGEEEPRLDARRVERRKAAEVRPGQEADQVIFHDWFSLFPHPY